MTYDDPSDEKNLECFSKPFHDDFTPYLKYDFSAGTITKCSNVIPEDLAKDRVCKVIVLGDMSVGKTCLVNRFCYKKFNSDYQSTIGIDFAVEKIKVLNVPLTLHIWDTAGQEKFQSIAKSYYRNARAIVIVFDFSEVASLYTCKMWLKCALHANATDPFIFLVGTKKDAVSTSVYCDMEMNGANLAREMNAEFWPVSSKDGENIEDLFHRIASLVFDELICEELERNLSAGTELITLNVDKKKRKKKKKFRSKISGCC